MSTKADFVLEAPETDRRLFVEAKNASAPSDEWAADLLRNVLAHSVPRENESFLLALRNHFYLWKHPQNRQWSAKPDCVLRTEDVLKPYLASLSTSLEEMKPAAFEILIRAWLNDLVAGNLDVATKKCLRDTGLDEFAHGTVTSEEHE